MQGTFTNTESSSVSQAQIATVRQAVKDGWIKVLAHAKLIIAILTRLRPAKNGCFVAVVTDKALAAEFGIDVRTVARIKRRMAALFHWFRWYKSPDGTAYLMHPDGSMRGKCVGAFGHSSPNEEEVTKKEVAVIGKGSLSDSISCGEKEPAAGSSPRCMAPAAALAAWVPTEADIAFGVRLRLTEREIAAEAARRRRWYVDPDHPWRLDRIPADLSASFEVWLERGAAKKALAKAAKEAAELRRQAAELDLKAAEAERERAADRARQTVDDIADECNMRVAEALEAEYMRDVIAGLTLQERARRALALMAAEHARNESLWRYNDDAGRFDRNVIDEVAS